MTLYDYFLMTVIIAGAFVILYRSLWKKKGHCSGCSAGSCCTGNRNGVSQKPNCGGNV